MSDDKPYWERIPARPTMYRGIRMRSRLEASYAGALDGLGLSWQYEGDAFADATGQYLPDFRVTMNDGRVLYVEVKPVPGGGLDVLHNMRIIRSTEPNALLALALPGWGSTMLVDLGDFAGTACWATKPPHALPDSVFLLPMHTIDEMEELLADGNDPITMQLADELRIIVASFQLGFPSGEVPGYVPFQWGWK